MERILFVDDDAGGRQLAAFNLRKAGYEVDEAEDAEQGLRQFTPAEHMVVITDVRMPGINGIELTRRVHALSPDTPVLVITAYGNIDTAVEAMKAGAFDFVVKPFSRDQLLMAVQKLAEHVRLTNENRDLRRQVRGIERPIVHQSSVMEGTLAMADRVADSQASVLVTGESGTGKELVARRIHSRSPRADAPFVPVNCAAIPAELIEAELFGHVKGAFTGAGRSRPGRFRQADGGSIFLDEVGELPAQAQSKLLRVLQEGVIDVVGSDEPVSVDVRVIAATNKELRAEVAAGKFREDLYFRLNVVEIGIPPLRTRVDDIPALIRHFVAEFLPGQDVAVPAEVLDALSRREWVGNVRELRNACERMVILSPHGELSLDCLPTETKYDADTNDTWKVGEWLRLPPEGVSLLDLEKAVIERALLHTRGNISEAARFLKVPRHFLIYRVEKYGIDRPGKR